MAFVSFHDFYWLPEGRAAPGTQMYWNVSIKHIDIKTICKIVFLFGCVPDSTGQTGLECIS